MHEYRKSTQCQELLWQCLLHTRAFPSGNNNCIFPTGHCGDSMKTFSKRNLNILLQDEHGIAVGQELVFFLSCDFVCFCNELVTTES